MDIECIICGKKIPNDPNNKSDKPYSYECSSCGRYHILPTGSFPRFEDDFKSKASSIACEKKLMKQDDYLLTYDIQSKVAYADGVPFLNNYPRTFPEKLDRTLLNLARKTDFYPRKGTLIDIYEKCAICFANLNDQKGVDIVFNCLEKEGYIERGKDSVHNDFQLTLQGIRKALELQERMETNENAFIAMWFDDSLVKYEDAVQKAIRNAGYVPRIIKNEPHNDYIMERVLNLIRDSRFVIADLTSQPEVDESGKKPSCGVRGGVYFEAGFALGMGLPVILTCRDDSPARDRIHFDLAQRNTIFWKEDNGTFRTSDKDFVETLKEHIIFTVGRGPLPEK